MADEPMDFTQTLNDPATSRGARAAPASRKVIVISLCTDRQFTTQGTQTYKYFVVGPRALFNIGPHIEDIVGQARGKDFTTYFNWKLTGEKSVDGDLWEQFGTGIIAVQTGAGQIVAPAHTARADYANNIRFVIGVATSSGGAAEIGNLTAYAAIKFWT